MEWPEGAPRVFRAADGRMLRAFLAPRERREGGTAEAVVALVFEDEMGRWIGSTLLQRGIPLWSLTGEEMERMLARGIPTSGSGN